MKIILILIGVFIIGFITYFFYLGYSSSQNDGFDPNTKKLVACPDKPNCVGSEYPNDDNHYIKPIQFSLASNESIKEKVLEVLSMMNAEVVINNKNYIASTFTSNVFQFVDSFEIRIDHENESLHIRSASRVGHSDFNANRKRVELFRKLISAP